MPSSVPPFRTERRLLSPAHIGVPEVLLLGCYHYTIAHPPLLPHSHDGVIELCFLERGRQFYSFAGGPVHCLRGGEAIVVQPGEVHDTGRLPEFPGRLYWLQVRAPRSGEAVLGLNAEDTAALFELIRRLPRQFQAGANMRDLFEAAFDTENLRTVQLRPAAFRARIVELLLACSEVAERDERPSLPPAIARALRSQLGDTAVERIGLAELAHARGLSESYFKALFRRSLGMPPAEFFRLLRLEQAQLQLRNTPATITEIALAAGFSSSQHFATAFRKQYRCTPRAFRAQRSGGPEAAQPLHGAGVTFHPIAADRAATA